MLLQQVHYFSMSSERQPSASIPFTSNLQRRPGRLSHATVLTASDGVSKIPQRKGCYSVSSTAPHSPQLFAPISLS